MQLLQLRRQNQSWLSHTVSVLVAWVGSLILENRRIIPILPTNPHTHQPTHLFTMQILQLLKCNSKWLTASRSFFWATLSTAAYTGGMDGRPLVPASSVGLTFTLSTDSYGFPSSESLALLPWELVRSRRATLLSLEKRKQTFLKEICNWLSPGLRKRTKLEDKIKF